MDISIDVLSKQINSYTNVDLCSSRLINPKVSELYYRYQNECNSFGIINDNVDCIERKYYVYAWKTKKVPKRYFYVGKGTGQRYRHILAEIKSVREGKSNNWRYKKYCIIEEVCGIEHEILLDKLTEYEALLYEQCMKLFFIDQGEVLLNVEGMPSNQLPEGYEGKQVVCSIPTLQKSRFRQRYLCDDTIPNFDSVNCKDLLRTFLYPYFLSQDEQVERNYEVIRDWVTRNKGKIYSTISTKTSSVVIHGYLPEETYISFRDRGLSIYSAFDVISFINDDKI